MFKLTTNNKNSTMKRFFTLLAVASIAYIGVAQAQATVESVAPQDILLERG